MGPPKANTRSVSCFKDADTAVTASELGLRVVVLERSEHVGGAAAYSGGQVWAPANHVASRAGIADTVEDGIAYVTAIASAFAASSLVRGLCRPAMSRPNAQQKLGQARSNSRSHVRSSSSPPV